MQQLNTIWINSAHESIMYFGTDFIS